MTKRNVYDAQGQFLRVLGENDIIKDGERVRFEMTMMDSLNSPLRFTLRDGSVPIAPRSAPGYVQVVDSDHDDRAQRYFDRRQQLADAWKQAPPLAATAETAKPAHNQPPLTNDADAAYDRRCVLLEQSWRGA